DESKDSLAKVAFQWMVREAEQLGLLVDAKERDRFLNAPGQPHYDPQQSHPDPLIEINESLRGAWKFAEWLPHRVFDRHTKSMHWTGPNFGKRRFIEDHSVIHASVETRLKATNYRPPNLPPNFTVEY